MSNSQTVRKYLIEQFFSGETKITEIILDPKPIIRTEETYFHPQGGGQKSDRGCIGSSHVIHVMHNGPFVDHYVDSVEGLTIGQTYPYSIDTEWRKLNSTYHTAGHLIASLIDSKKIGLTAVSGHQWPGEARVEFSIEEGAVCPLTPEKLTEELLNICKSKLSVNINGDPFKNREIQIGDFPGIPCGGTHLQTLQQIGEIRVNSIKAKSGKVRISYEVSPA